MKLLIIVRDDVTIANGVVFGPGAIIVHSLLRRDRDSVTRFARLADVRQAYSGCKVQMVETASEATYSYVVRKTRQERPPARKKKAAKRAKRK